AGNHTASADPPPTTASTTNNVQGSEGATPKSRRAIARAATTETRRPVIVPASVTRSPCQTPTRALRADWAPRPHAHRRDPPRLGAHLQPDPDLSHALFYSEADEPIETNRGEQQGGAAE